MNAPSTSAIERRLLALDYEEFVAFVAALWRACDWDVSRDGAVLDVSRHGASKRLLVLPPRRIVPGIRAAPQIQGSVDAIVSPLAGTGRASLPRGTPDAPVIDAETIRERLCYAVDGEDRERLLVEHLGGERPSDGTDSGSTGREWVVPVLRVPRQAGTSVAGVGIFLVLVGLATVLLATGLPFGDSTSGTANASEPEPTGGYATASADVYETTRTCERGPGEIAEVATSATRGPRITPGLVVLGEFWNPRNVQNLRSGVWRDMMTTEAHLAFYDAESVHLDEAVIDGDQAAVNATATIDGEEREYVYVFDRSDTDADQGCWMIEEFGPV